MQKATYTISYRQKVEDCFNNDIPLVIEQTRQCFPDGSPSTTDTFFAWYPGGFVSDCMTLVVWRVKFKKRKLK